VSSGVGKAGNAGKAEKRVVFQKKRLEKLEKYIMP